MRNEPTSPPCTEDAPVSAGYVGQDPLLWKDLLQVATAARIILRKPFLSNRIFRFFN
jgi:hypothetical protein